MAKKQLIVSLDELPITERIIGVSCTLRPYKLCHFINKNEGFDFGLIDEGQDHSIFLPQKKKLISFTTFVHQDRDYGFKIFMIANKNSEGFLLPELTNIDYILISDKDIHVDYYQQLLHNLKAIAAVNFVIELQTKNLKSKHNLYISQ